MISYSLDGSLPHFPFALVTPLMLLRNPNTRKDGRRERQSPWCDQSGSHPFDSPLGFARGFGKTGQALAQKNAQGWGALGAGCARE
jgi:hypothetical protein